MGGTRRRTYNYAGQIENIPSYRETKCRGDRGTGGLEKNAVRVNRLGSILKGVRSEVFPVFDDRLVFK